MKKTILLGFDLEEFDLPLENNGKISFEDQLNTSDNGINIVLDLLVKYDLTATFFCTVNFAKNRPEVLQRIVREEHEIASHGCFHNTFSPEDYQKSKEELDYISGGNLVGFRMARMQEVDFQKLKEAGYLYDSSINPTFIPGRYNHLKKPFHWHLMPNGLVEIPSAVTSRWRIPLFWLSFHNFPLKFYYFCLNQVLKNTGYAVLYFHPWEFTNLNEFPERNIPFIIRRNSGIKMIHRFQKMVEYYLKRGVAFDTTRNYLNDTGAFTLE
jgi:peptidoglycan/xylan/chitin deacetylase (PgdA/CDA1 family)